MEMQKKLNILKKISISRISDTRWSCRSHNCEIIIENYDDLIQVLSEEIENNNDRDIVEAKSIIIY